MNYITLKLISLKAKIHNKITIFLSQYTAFDPIKLMLFLSKYPSLYYSYFLGIDSRFPELAIKKDTDLVIEGFPRTANTFAVVAFQKVQPGKLKIAHHLHVPAQVIRAMAWNIPCLVLIRNPIDAIVSLIIRHPDLKIDLAFDWYISFYQPLLKFKEKIIIADFELIIKDYGKVISLVNQKFATNFVNITPIGETLEQILAEIEIIEPSPLMSCNPNSQKENLKPALIKQLKTDYSNQLQLVNALYLKMIS